MLYAWMAFHLFALTWSPASPDYLRVGLAELKDAPAMFLVLHEHISTSLIFQYHCLTMAIPLTPWTPKQGLPGVTISGSRL